MSTSQRAAALVVALLSVVIVAVVLLSGDDGTIGRDRGGSPSPAPTQSPPTAATASPTESPPPASPGEGEILEAIARIEEQVIEIRGLPAADIGPAELIGREQLVEELEALFEAEYPVEDRERDNFVLRAFGLIGPDDDVAELQLQLLGDQVLGFYDSQEQRMVVVTDRGLDPEARITYAHEYTHALQDASFGIDSLETDAVGEDDRSLARVALLEGDATVTMLAWALRHLSQQELMEVSGQPVPDTSGIPSWMVNQLIFPYTAGQLWVMGLVEQAGGNPLQPDFTEVDAAYDDPPVSTAQIIDIEKWNDRVEPAPVETPDLAAALGGEWDEVDTSPVGQASIGIMLEHFGVGTTEATDAADGWAGDRAVVARGPDDAFAVAWRSTWETPDDAAAFAAAYETVVDAVDFPVLVTRIGDLDVLVAHASDSDVLRRTVEAAR